MTEILNVALMGIFVWSGIGGAVPEAAAQTPTRATTTIEALSVKLTGYNAVSEQTDDDPHVTASGAFSNPEVIAARSRDLAETMPFGTIISLEAPENKAFSCGFKTVEHLIGYRVIADSMHRRKEKQVDILYDMANAVNVGGKPINPAIAAGICEVKIRVVGKILIKDIPATQAELAKLVNKGNKELAIK